MTRSEGPRDTDFPAGTVAINRLFDDGGPVYFREVPGSGFPWPAFILHTSSCDRPRCECQDAGFLVRPVVADGEEIVAERNVVVEGLIHLETGRIEPDVEPAEGSPESALLERFRERLVGDRLEALRVRWRRAKHQNDLGEWKAVDWSRVDLADRVPFFEIFPSRWDLAIALDGRLWWIVDLWCLKPGCGCEEVALSLHADGGDEQAFVVVDLRSRALAGPKPNQTGLRLWEILRENAEVLAELDERRTTIRRVARKLPAHLAPAKPAAPPAPVGRNEPCPCGSGKKFKRCCGGVAAQRGAPR